MSWSNRVSISERFNRIVYFFPFQLVLLHIKKNHLLLVFWLVLFGYTTSLLANKYGVPILFLYPEYLGENGVWAYGLLGFSCGGFITAFNLYSYIMHGFRFPFIASISKPFLKFSINNFIIPLIFVTTYLLASADFQLNKEFVPPETVAINLSAFVFGIFVFISVSLAYFLRTNKDVFKIFKGKKKTDSILLPSVEQAEKRWENLRKNRRTWRVETYMAGPFKIRLARHSAHYNSEIIRQILSQNHINASIYELLVIASFFVIGTFRELPFFMLPAAASLFLVFTMLLMMISAFFSWFKGWTTTVLVLIILLLNQASSRKGMLSVESRAYGLNYDVESVDFNQYLQVGLPTQQESQQDRENVRQILENRGKAIAPEKGNTKPKLIFVNSSGGGLRSGLWSFRCMTYLDSLTEGLFFDHTQLITGSSGGMLGVAYYRELKRLSIERKHPISNWFPYFRSLGADMLNPITFSLVTNDLFIRYQNFVDRGHQYVKDRGFAFEKQLNENTGYVLDRRLIDYRMGEQRAEVPMMIITPTILNDARKMMISSTPVSFMTRRRIGDHQPIVENIDFQHLLKDHDAPYLKLTTALRMSATFPYILPTVSLPTNPTLDLMDAGIRDNYGLTPLVDFLSEYHNWIQENTSGVVIIQFRDVEKEANFIKNVNSSFISRMVSPLGTVYGNIFNTHNYNQDQVYQLLRSSAPYPVEMVVLELYQTDRDRISLSLHLTELEKKQIHRGVYHPRNQEQFNRIRELLGR